jgi:hypothetical protein
MVDFFFFLKTLFLTLIVVLLLQIEVDKKTVETHVHDWMVGSYASGFLGNAAHGGAHFLKDATFKLTRKMKEHIGSRHKGEDHDTKSSHFRWGWDKVKDDDIENQSEAKKGTPLDDRDTD